MADWEAGTGEHALFALSDAEAAIDLLGQPYRQCWLLLTATDGSDTWVLAAGYVTIHEAGL